MSSKNTVNNPINSDVMPESVEKTKNVSMVKTPPDITSAESEAEVKAAVDQMLDEVNPKNYFIDTPYFRVNLKVLSSVSATKSGVILKNRAGGIEGFANFDREKNKLAFLKHIKGLMIRCESGEPLSAEDLDMDEYF